MAAPSVERRALPACSPSFAGQSSLSRAAAGPCVTAIASLYCREPFQSSVESSKLVDPLCLKGQPEGLQNIAAVHAVSTNTLTSTASNLCLRVDCLIPSRGQCYVLEDVYRQSQLSPVRQRCPLRLQWLSAGLLRRPPAARRSLRGPPPPAAQLERLPCGRAEAA